MAGGGAPTGSAAAGSYDSSKNYTGPLVMVTMLFFMWGFITCMNDILIPKLKAVFDLSFLQASLIQFTFFGAYFIVALIYFIISKTGQDPIAKIGYKKAIILGLSVAGVGCFLFYPAAETKLYSLFLAALFILASGVTILQIAANPYVALLGKPEGASGRLNLTQAFNSVGTTVAPIVGSALILSETSGDTGSADSVKMPYIALAATLVVLAIIIGIIALPKVVSSSSKPSSKGAWGFRHLRLGVLGIFFYVGGEVAIGSLLVNYLALENIAGLPETTAAYYLALYWGGAMIGRFFGAIFLSNAKMSTQIILVAGILAGAFGFSYYLTEQQIDLTLEYLVIIVLNVVAFLLGSKIPGKTLGIFASFVTVALIVGSFMSGTIAMWAIVGIGLFNSIMFPNIFTLAIKGLGINTSQASSLLVMAIVGGALILPVQSAVADKNLQLSFLIPVACYAYIAYYGFKGSEPVPGEIQEDDPSEEFGESEKDKNFESEEV